MHIGGKVPELSEPGLLRLLLHDALIMVPEAFEGRKIRIFFLKILCATLEGLICKINQLWTSFLPRTIWGFWSCS